MTIVIFQHLIVIDQVSSPVFAFQCIPAGSKHWQPSQPTEQVRKTNMTFYIKWKLSRWRKQIWKFILKENNLYQKKSLSDKTRINQWWINHPFWLTDQKSAAVWLFFLQRMSNVIRRRDKLFGCNLLNGLVHDSFDKRFMILNNFQKSEDSFLLLSSGDLNKNIQIPMS